MSDFLNPRNPGGVRWIHIHVSLLICIVVGLLSFGAGYFTGSAVTGAYYRSHYQAPLPVPKARHAVTAHVGNLPSAAGINPAYFTAQIDDQGPVGSCEAWTFAKLVSYEFNAAVQPNGKHYHAFWSPRFIYDLDTQGNDVGSNLEEYPPILAQQGWLRWKAMPYGNQAASVGLPAYADDALVPVEFMRPASDHHFIVAPQRLWGFTQGAGQAGVDLIRQQLAAHHPVNIDFPVYPEYDRANADGSTVLPPTPGESSRGGHANTAVSYDDTHPNGDGTDGAILVSNQWGWTAGVGRDGARHTDARHNGYIWLSYAFVAQEVFDPASIQIVRAAGARAIPPQATDPNAPLHPAPQRVGSFGGTGAQSWHVHGVTITTGQDVSSLLNHWGDVYHVWPLGLAATLGVESALNPYAERWAGGLDNSCGLAQQILVNVAAYTGITDPRAACNWEEVPANSIYLEARLYAAYFAYQRGCVTWPTAYEMYNAGPGLSCSWYYNPSAEVYQHQQNFLGWWAYALSHWQGGSPPAPPHPKPRPKAFPLKAWNAYCHGYHTRCGSPYDSRHHLIWAASIFQKHPQLHGKRPLDRWIPPSRKAHRRFGFDVYFFAHGRALAWPHWHAYKVVLK